MSFDPIEFLDAAVRIRSDESVDEMREFLIDQLESEGISPQVDSAGNTIARRGSGSPNLILNTHIDTVGPHLPVEREDAILRGRGACDAKGPLAAMIAAFLRADPAGQCTLAVTPDEETRSTGAAALDLDGDAYIVGEPTGLDICTAAKGRFEGTITITGSNAHAAEPDAGQNAVAAAAPVLSALATYDANHGPGPHQSLGAPTLTPTVIDGGDTTNQVPESCSITVDRRSVPPETAAGFQETLQQHLRAAVPDDIDVSFRLIDRPTPFLEAFSTPRDDRIVGVLTEAGAGDIRPFTAATEASYFAKSAPTVVFGPGELVDEQGAVAHADREYVDIDAVSRAASILERTIDLYGGFVD